MPGPSVAESGAPVPPLLAAAAAKGGFYRVHEGRGVDENLNAPGMHFTPMTFDDACLPDLRCGPECSTNRLYAYGVVARLAQLAASRELEATAPDA